MTEQRETGNRKKKKEQKETHNSSVYIFETSAHRLRRPYWYVCVSVCVCASVSQYRLSCCRLAPPLTKLKSDISGHTQMLILFDHSICLHNCIACEVPLRVVTRQDPESNCLTCCCLRIMMGLRWHKLKRRILRLALPLCPYSTIFPDQSSRRLHVRQVQLASFTHKTCSQ